MPVYRPTANSIWNSFRRSGKRHLILTGAMGCGKTTLLSQLFPTPLLGITTWAEPYQAVFMRNNRTGTSVKIAQYDASLPGTTAKMVLCGDTMCSFGIPILQECTLAENEWVSIDEIGFLEETCERYQDAIRELFARKRVVAVIRKQNLPFLNELRCREDVFVVDLDNPFGDAGCVIMASGLGKRFGGNKLMVDFLGEPLITRILDATEGIFAKRVVVTRHESIVTLCQKRKIPVVLHDLPDRNDTVRLGLEAIGNVERCMFCQGDQPLLSQDTIASLLLCAVHQPKAIWRTCYDNTPSSPILFPTWTFSQLQTLPTGKGGSWLVKQYPEKVAQFSVENPYELMDADTPEALEQLKRNTL